MANHYCFECPIKGGAAMLTDCTEVHNLCMKGRPAQVEDKVCAVAHLAHMCPVRHAFRMGGPWSKPDFIPFAPDPMSAPAKLPADLVGFALAHRLPYDSDYRRVGLEPRDPEVYDRLDAAHRKHGRSDAFKPGLSKSAPKPVRAKSRPAEAQPKPPAKPQSFTDAIHDTTQDMADTVTALARRDAQRHAQSATEPETRSDTQTTRDAPTARSQKPTAPSAKLSLAERAKLMRERREARS